jgi:alpha-glucosidase
VAEVGGSDAEAEMKAFTSGNHRLNSAYGFNFLYADALTAPLVRAAMSQWPDEPGMGWPSWAFENHDAPRAVSRWVDAEHRTAFRKLKMLLLACLRGNIILYYGEELGLTQVDIAFDCLRDPEAIANWPLTLSRDGARTPMPWRADRPALGFSTGEPWLPPGPDHAELAVDRQNRDPDSPLAWTRAALALRHAHAALMTGRMDLLDTPNDVLAFERYAADQRMLCVFNIGNKPVRWVPAEPDCWQVVMSAGPMADWSFDGFAALVAIRKT